MDEIKAIRIPNIIAMVFRAPFDLYGLDVIKDKNNTGLVYGDEYEKHAFEINIKENNDNAE